MVGFPLIKRRATAAVARFRETLSATMKSDVALRGRWTAVLRTRPVFVFTVSRSPRVAYFLHRRRYVGDDGSRTLFVARDVSSPVLDKKRVIAEITGA